MHETFLGRTGDLVFTIWPRALCRMDWTTREIRTITEYNAWHIAPDRAGTRILCDTNHPDEGLQIIDAETGSTARPLRFGVEQSGLAVAAIAIRAGGGLRRMRAIRLSWMENAVDTVYGPQHTHPHPSWSNDESMVTFASDRTGVTQVYVATV